MVDQILAVSVVLLPTLFAVGIEVVSKEIKEHLNWRIAVLGFGVGLSVLTWFQMSRAANNARKDQEDAIKTTATKVSEQVAPRVAAETSTKVTEALNRDYGKVISDLYKEIGQLEGRITKRSENEMALNYMMDVDLIYAGGQLQVWNRGKTEISLWGDKYDAGPRDISGNPVFISPTTNYYLLTNNLERNIREKLGQNNEDRVSFDLYLQSANGRKYIMHTTLWEIVKDGQITIHTQNNGYEERDWSKQPS